MYAAGLVQGIALVTFPAAGTVFTSPTGTTSPAPATGAVPAPGADCGARVAARRRLARRVGTRPSTWPGSWPASGLDDTARAQPGGPRPARPRLRAAALATAFLGVGFGLVVPTLNTLTAAFHPDQRGPPVLVLNALLGLGTTLAPVFVAIFVGLGFWWGLPVLAVVLIAVLLAGQPPPAAARGRPGRGRRRRRRRAPIPARFWVFAAFAVLYGMCETMNGNWSQIEMTRQIGASATVASLALTAFWGMVTVGRVLFAAVQRAVPPTRDLPRAAVRARLGLLVVALLPHGAQGTGPARVRPCGTGLLGPAAADHRLRPGAAPRHGAARSSGGVIAFYQIGYGIAAFGSGPLQDAGVGLPALFGATAVVALVLAGLAGVLATQSRRARARLTSPSPSAGGMRCVTTASPSPFW